MGKRLGSRSGHPRWLTGSCRSTAAASIGIRQTGDSRRCLRNRSGPTKRGHDDVRTGKIPAATLGVTATKPQLSFGRCDPRGRGSGQTTEWGRTFWSCRAAKVTNEGYWTTLPTDPLTWRPRKCRSTASPTRCFPTAGANAALPGSRQRIPSAHRVRVLVATRTSRNYRRPDPRVRTAVAIGSPIFCPER